MRIFLGFDAVVIIELNISSSAPVDILSFVNFYLETDIAQGKIFRRKGTGTSKNFTMDFDPDYNIIKNFREGFFSNKIFALKKTKSVKYDHSVVIQ